MDATLIKTLTTENSVCTVTIPVLRLWLINSACKCCECALARERGEGQSAISVEQFTSAPQKIRLNVSSTSLHCTFTQRAWREEVTVKQKQTLEWIYQQTEEGITAYATRCNQQFYLLHDGKYRHFDLKYRENQEQNKIITQTFILIQFLFPGLPALPLFWVLKLLPKIYPLGQIY